MSLATARWILAVAVATSFASSAVAAPAAPSDAASAPTAGSTVADAPPSRSTRVMPLGDSLTDGFNLPGGYRIELASRLTAGEVPVDFVGSLVNGPASLADQDHEGHSGFRIDEIAASVAGWMDTYRPDIVLLMIGTNDVVQGYRLDTAPLRLGALIDDIAAARPASHTIVASIPQVAGAPYNERVADYNAAIVDVIEDRIAEGMPVSFVDVYDVIEEDDLHTDNTHLNAAGYCKVADLWYAAIRGNLGLGAPAGAGTTADVCRTLS